MPNIEFSIVLPYFNEADFIEVTLDSLLKQHRLPDEIILVDNASTDESAEICRRVVGEAEFEGAVHLNESRPGKIHALEQGCSHAKGSWIVLADADTYYPPHYLSLIEQLIRTGPENLVAVAALPATAQMPSMSDRLRRWFRVSVVAALLRKQVHTGGYGLTLRRSVLERVGGFSKGRWPFVLMDHEIMHRMLKAGTSRYHSRLWCVPSKRRSDRSRVRWTLPERLLYNLSPFAAKDWLFYTFLWNRFTRRGLRQKNLREKTWQSDA